MEQFGCLIVGFRRVEEIVQVMDKVKHEGFDQVYISIDSARGLVGEVVQQNLNLRKIVSSYTQENGLNWGLIFQEERFGIIKNFTTSIDHAFEKCDYLCILEDDCVPAPGILAYYKSALNFDFSNRVKMLTFFRPHIKGISQGNFATHNPLMWGWGISKRDWIELKQSIAPTSAIRGLAKAKSLPFQGFYYSGYSRARSEESDALDALVAYYLLVNDYLVIGPPVSLISNIGFGSLATNTQEKSVFMGVEVTNWNSIDYSNQIEMSLFSVFKNDLAIARGMNQWKIHHIFSSYLKRILLTKLAGK
jgi:hypothetical protein